LLYNEEKKYSKGIFSNVYCCFFVAIFLSSSITWQSTFATAVDEKPSTYMNGQRIATYAEMGIDSLLSKYEKLK
jgi:hypothetical protein